MNCFKPPSTQRKADLNKYTYLHPDGRKLISGWFGRAWQSRDARPEDCFEPFVFAWFAVNGWAACVTGEDTDRDYLKILAADEAITKDFRELTADIGKPSAIYAEEFAAYWPVFEVKDLRKKKILRSQKGERIAVVNRYLNEGAEKFEPQCWQEHKVLGEPVPVDWAHTLFAIYRVRCNLFHGEKAAHSEMDQMIVAKAFKTLVHFFSSAQYIR